MKNAMKTLTDLREELRPTYQHATMVTENHFTTFDDFFANWPGYCEAELTLSMPMTDEAYEEFRTAFLESVWNAEVPRD